MACTWDQMILICSQCKSISEAGIVFSNDQEILCEISRTKFRSSAKISLWQTDCKTLLQCSFTLDSKIHGNNATYIFGQMWTRVSTQHCSLSTIIVMLVTLLNFHLTKNFISQLTQDQISDWEAGESKRAFCHSLHLRLFSFFITSGFCSILVLKGQMELFRKFIRFGAGKLP